MNSHAHGTVDIVATDLNVQYDSTFELRCPQLNLTGNVVAILGHNGAGKSTFIKTLLGLLPTQRGKLEVFRREGEERLLLLPEAHMAFCPENGAVFTDISVESYVKLWCRIKQRDGSYYKRQGSKIIEQLHLGPLMKKLGRELSKGQRRRVQTAIGFLTAPKLFMFDEPFDGLDVQRSRELTDLMEVEAQQMSIMLSSHRMDVIERLADSVIVLREGQIVASGAVDAVCQKLCGPTWTIAGLDDPEALLHPLKRDFPDALVGKLGTQLSITGHAIEFQRLEQVVRSMSSPAVKLEETRSTLTDAMNYHLREVSSRNGVGHLNGV